MHKASINQKYLHVAIQAAKKAALIFIKHFGKAGKVKAKNGDPRDPVTKIDFRLEKLIRQTIKNNFPCANIIGEELGGKTDFSQGPTWLIDPIDGTHNYILGIPLTCISIGVWDKNGPLVGVVSNPILNQTYTALRGKGARLNRKKIQVSKVTRLREATGTTGWRLPKKGLALLNKIIPKARKIRVLASSSWQTCMVASGQLDFHLTKEVNIWDLGGPLVILQEAGGKFSDFSGYNLQLNLKECVVSNKNIHNELLKAVN